MTTAAYSELKIEGYNGYNGVLNTIQIFSSSPTSYQLAYPSWSPSVSKRKDAVISGGSSYEPVIDELTLNIVSTISAADCMAKLSALINLLDQADRWFDNQFIYPIWLYYRPKGSTKDFLYNALILGNRTIQDWASLPVTYDDVGTIWRINGVVIRFERSGLWLQTDTADTVVGTLSNPFTLTALTLTKTLSRVMSPVDLSFGDFNTAAIPQPIPASLLILTDVDDNSNLRCVTKNALNFAGVAKYTSVNDAAKNAVGTNVMRYTPTDTAYNNSALVSLDSVFGYNFAVYASVRNNTASASFTIKVNLVANNGTTTSAAKHSTAETVIDTSILTPRVVFLGTVSRVTNDNPKAFLSIKASAVAGSLDIDQLVFVALDDETTNIIELQSFNLTTELGAGTYALGFWSNVGPLAKVAPYYGFMPTRATVTLGIDIAYSHHYYIGDLPVVMRNNRLNWLWMCVAANGVDRWQYVDNANNPKQTRCSVIQRHMAYLIPE